MNLLVKNALISDPGNELDGKVINLTVLDSVFNTLSKSPIKEEKGVKIIDAKGSVLSPGFFDLNCSSGDPGFETREDFTTLNAAAAAGGFTGVALMPSTMPVVQSRSAIDYLRFKTRGAQVDVYPVGAVSKDLEGQELAEMFDMHAAGAVAFADGNKPMKDDGFMSRALQYAQGFGGLIMSFPENRSIAGKALINESANSILLGMKGNPALAEEMQIARDIFLAGYHNAPVHISSISTSGAVKLIKKAKKDGIRITCDVAAFHLVFSEEALEGFDTNFKVSPPLRGMEDVKALLAGLKDGTIDAVSSRHDPYEIEFKAVEFQTAKTGIISLQTVLPMLISAGLGTDLITQKLSVAPRKILGLEKISIKPGNKANFVLYDPSKKWIFDSSTNRSRSSNSPLFGQELTGMVTGTFNNGQFTTYE